VRRVRPRGSQLALFSTYDYHAFILRHEALLVRVGVGAHLRLSQQTGEAEGSLILKTQGRAGAALTTPDGLVLPDGPGPASETGRCTSAETSGGTPSSVEPAQTWWIRAGQQCTSGRLARSGDSEA